MNTHKQLLERITEYLSNGGLFNPEYICTQAEYMDHQAVQRLLIDIRDYLIETPPRQTFPTIPTTPWSTACPVCDLDGINGYVCYNPKCPTKITAT